MKKLLVLLMCLGVCLQLAACGLEEDTKWIDEAAEKMEKDITSGEIVIDGDVFTFPMDLQDILDKGWHVSNNYSDADEFKLEPGQICEEFQLYPDDDRENAIIVSVINMTRESVTVHDCMVIYLEVDSTEFDYVLPGGITKRSTFEEIEAAYEGEEVEEGDTNNKYLYSYTTEDGYNCEIELKAYGPSTNKQTVSYSLIYSDTSNVANECIQFIDLAMKASYHNDLEEYVANLYDTKEGAEELYMSEVMYYASALMYYAYVDESYVTEEIKNEYSEIAKTLLAKAKWEISKLDVSDYEYSGTVELTLYPTNYLYIIEDKVNGVIDAYNTKYADVDFDTVDDATYTEMECDYANMVLEAIKGMENEVEYADPVVKTYEIAEEVLTDEEWEEIDDIIMGLAE